jgi:hypothetical protein
MLVPEGPLVPQAMLLPEGPLVPQAILLPHVSLDPQTLEEFQMVLPFGRTVPPQTAVVDHWADHAQLLATGRTK